MGRLVESFLNRYISGRERMAEIETDIRILEDRLNSVTAAYSSEPSSSGALPGDARNAALAKLADKEREYAEVSKRTYDSREEIFQFLEKLPDHRVKRAMQLKYCDEKTISEIASLLFCVNMTVYRYLRSGLTDAENLYFKQRRNK